MEGTFTGLTERGAAPLTVDWNWNSYFLPCLQGFLWALCNKKNGDFLQSLTLGKCIPGPRCSSSPGLEAHFSTLGPKIPGMRPPPFMFQIVSCYTAFEKPVSGQVRVCACLYMLPVCVCMLMSVCVCVCRYRCVCVHVYVYMCACVCTHVCLCVCMQVQMCVQMW